MTKPIVGVAMMMLWEQGKWTLDDPVARHIPEFAGLKVATPNGDVSQTRPMTMRQLMSHTAGFDVNEGYATASLRDSDLQAMILPWRTPRRGGTPSTGVARTVPGSGSIRRTMSSWWE
jgi:CubicO group peptidase (beta-lactamase class C family)